MNRMIPCRTGQAGLAARALLVLLICLGCFGQAIDGRLVGTVNDSSSAAVPTASVVITNQNTGIVTKIQTDHAGNFVAPSLPAGTYNVRVEAPGFRVAVSTGNTVAVAQTTRVDFALQVGSVSESIEITGEAALVQSDSSDIGQTIAQQQVQTLPLNGRIFSQLVQLVPGAVAKGFGDATESGAGAGARTAITSSVNGVPWSAVSYTLDGVYNAEPLNAFINIAPPVEAIEEFKVQTSNPSAEFGTFGGAAVNLTLRSGTNQYHGSVFEFVRNEALNSRDFFSSSKAPYKTNQYGGTLGGPIVKNKFFFFGDYQGMRYRQGSTYNINVPTTAMKTGVMNSAEGFDTIYDPLSSSSSATTTPFANNTIPSARFDPVSAKVLNLWAPGNVSSAVGPYSNYQENVSNKQNVEAFDVKFDYQFETLGRLFFRESYNRRDSITAGPGGDAYRFMYSGPDAKNRSQNAVLGYSLPVRQNLMNEIRFGFNRFYTTDFGHDYGTDENNILGIKNGNLAAFAQSSGIASFAIGDLYDFGTDSWTDAVRLADVFQLSDNATWIKNSHTVKFGADIKRIRSTLTNPDNSPRGSFSFGRDMTSQSGTGGAEFASFLLGYPNDIARGLVNTRPDVRMVQAGFFVQDDWRVSPSLTLNLGLRWDLYTQPVDNYNRQANYNPTTGLFYSATSSNRGPNVDTYKKNFGPRVGFAYAPSQSKFVIRGAFGMSYFRDNYGANGGTLERNYPLFENFEVTPTTAYRPFAQLSVDGLPTFTPTAMTASYLPGDGITPYYMPQNFRESGVMMWNVGVQHELLHNGVLEVAYVATRGTHLYRSRDINTPSTPAAGDYAARRPYYSISPTMQSIYERETDGVSQYNSLQMKYTYRFGHGLQALLSYTEARSMDDTSVFWPYDDTMNWTPSRNKAMDYHHSFSGSWTYELPFGKNRAFMAHAPRALEMVAGGWSINGIAVLHTGAPIAIYAADQTLNTGTTNYANVTCSSVGLTKTVSQWFDTSCFSNPAAYTFGNAKAGTVRGPGVVNFDLSAFKTFSLGEKRSLEVRGEFFNASNTPHFSTPYNYMSSSNFGKITSTALPPREVQLGAKLQF